MSRVNWMSIASWLALAVCVVLAFMIGYYSWNNLASTRREEEAVNHQIALQDRAKMELDQSRAHPSGVISAPDNGREDAEFLSQLQRLMLASGVKQVSLLRAALAPLPTIGRSATAATSGSAMSSTTKDGQPPAKPEYSLANLPLSERAISSGIVVVGQFSGIRQFTYLLRNYKYQVRTININSLQIASEDSKSASLRATYVLTRFVRPPDAALNPILSGVPGAEGNPSGAGELAPQNPAVPAPSDSRQRTLSPAAPNTLGGQ